MRVVCRPQEASREAVPEVLSSSLTRMHAEHRRMAAVRLGVVLWTTEHLGPVGGQPLHMLGIHAVGERVAELRILQAAFVKCGREGKERRLSARELEYGRPGHEGNLR